MLFNSYIFIFIFFPLCMGGFYLLASRERDLAARIWLIGFSLWFYGYFAPSYLLVMIVSILINYLVSRLITAHPGRRAPLVCGVAADLVILGVFKYLDFAISNINAVFGTKLPYAHILLPLGISFFTFQQIGYLVDTYRGEVRDAAFVDYALFVCFFPYLSSGPIVSQSEMLPQFATIRGRCADPVRIGQGLTLFVLGLAKKVLIADPLGRAVEAGYSMAGTLGGLDSFLVMIWYTLQLYFDFSGYCDMAIGLAGMLGFDLPVNFDSPYKAVDITDFWHRWHRTLTRFFTRYVYIPMGGSRRGEVRTIVNILIVYLLSGLWHGAGWNYVLWGALHGVAYAVVRTVMRYRERRRDGADKPASPAAISAVGRVLSRTVTFLYVAVAWVYFRAESISQGTTLLRNMITGSWRSINYELADRFTDIDELWYIVKFTGLPDRNWAAAHNLVMIVVTIAALVTVFALPNAYDVSRRIKPRVIPAILIGLLGVWCVLSLSEVSTFLYFNF